MQELHTMVVAMENINSVSKLVRAGNESLEAARVVFANDPILDQCLNSEDPQASLEGILSTIKRKMEGLFKYITTDKDTRQFVKAEHEYLRNELSVDDIVKRVKRVDSATGDTVVQIVSYRKAVEILEDIEKFGNLLKKYSPNRITHEYDRDKYFKYLVQEFERYRMEWYFGYSADKIRDMDFVALNISGMAESMPLADSGWLNKHNWDDLVDRLSRVVLIGQDIAMFGGMMEDIRKQLDNATLQDPENVDELIELLKKIEVFWIVGQGYIRIASNEDLTGTFSKNISQPVLKTI
jgi:hypothetical protein